MQTFMSGFRDKNIGKSQGMAKRRPSSRLGWRSSRRRWREQVTRVRKKVIKYIGEMDEDDNLEAEEDVENMMIDLKINPDLSDEMQDMLYDQLTQYTKKELLADVQVGGPEQSLESLRKAMAYGKKKTAENVHRNRVTRPEIAETMGQLEERYRSWK